MNTTRENGAFFSPAGDAATDGPKPALFFRTTARGSQSSRAWACLCALYINTTYCLALPSTTDALAMGGLSFFALYVVRKSEHVPMFHNSNGTRNGSIYPAVSTERPAGFLSNACIGVYRPSSVASRWNRPVRPWLSFLFSKVQVTYSAVLTFD
jgi:hypothetical protein